MRDESKKVDSFQHKINMTIKKGKVLKYILEGYSIAESCRKASVDYSHWHKNYLKDTEYHAKVQHALQSSKQAMEKLSPAEYMQPLIKEEDRIKPEHLDKIEVGLQRGLGLELSCLYASVSTAAMICLMKNNKDVLARMNTAEGSFILFCTQKIMEKANDDWKAAAWLLERRYPAHWCEIKQIELSTRIETTAKIIDAKAVETAMIDVTALTDEELIAYATKT
jgi:disulfide oxidoreductase YuzD